MDLAPGDQPVDRHLRAGRGLGVRHCQPLRPGGHRRALVATLPAPAEPGQHSGPAGVPGVDRSGAPEQFEGLANLVVRDRRQRPAFADPLSSLADSDPVVPDRVRVAERVEEHVGRRPDSQRLPGRQLHDRGHHFPLAADNRAASCSNRRTSPQVTDQATADIGVLSVGRLQTGPAAGPPPVARQRRRRLSARSDTDVPQTPGTGRGACAWRRGAAARHWHEHPRRRRPGAPQTTRQHAQGSGHRATLPGRRAGAVIRAFPLARGGGGVRR